MNLGPGYVPGGRVTRGRGCGLWLWLVLPAGLVTWLVPSALARGCVRPDFYHRSGIRPAAAL
jgi:hypothetical protein